MRKRRLPKPEHPPEDHVTGKSGRFIPAWKQHELSKANLANPRVPSWRNDPTYHLKRRPKP